MFFRQSRERDARSAAWSAAAERLGMVAVGDGQALLDRLIGVDADMLTAGVWRVANDAPPDVFVFERRSAAAAEPTVSCLLTVPGELAREPLRVTRRLRAQLAAFQASATQASVVTTGIAEFDEAVTVVARDTSAVRMMLTPALRDSLFRLVQRGERAPVLVISESTMLVAASLADPTGVEYLITDVLAVYAALVASGSA